MSGRPPAERSGGAQRPGAATQRVDKWLWCARVAKTRTQAAALVTEGKIRINRVKIDKPSHLVRPGDIITASLGPRVKILAIRALAERRGPASEAALLLEDMTPPPDLAAVRAVKLATVSGVRDAGAGRPTKRERRQTERLKGEPWNE